MSDQASTAPTVARSGAPVSGGASEMVPRAFPLKGQPLIRGVNRIGLWSLYIK